MTTIALEKDLNTVTPEEWRTATVDERDLFIEQQCRAGFVAFRCLQCGFPVAYGGQHCDACQGHGVDRHLGIFSVQLLISDGHREFNVRVSVTDAEWQQLSLSELSDRYLIPSLRAIRQKFEYEKAR